MPNARELCAVLAASAMVRARRTKDLGCIAEDLPPFELKRLATELSARVSGPLRLAVLGYSGKSDPRAPRVEFTTSETKANRWRNDEKAKAGTPLFVVVQGTVSKLKSLQTSVTVINERQLRELLSAEAIGWADTPARRAFWSALENNADLFSITSLLEFAAVGQDVATKSNRIDLPDCEAQNLHLLGLLPDRDFWKSAGEKKIGATLERNAGLAERLRLLTKKDRLLVARVAEADGELASVAQKVLQFHRTKKAEALRVLDFGAVSKVLTPKVRKPTAKSGDEEDSESAVPKGARSLRADEAGFLDLVENDGENLEEIASAIRDIDSAPEEDGPRNPKTIEFKSGQVVPKPRAGSAQAMSLAHRFATTEVFGGVARTDAADAVGCVKMFEAGESTDSEFRRLDKGAVGALMEQAVSVFGMSTDVVDRWRSYLAARTKLLRVRNELVSFPLICLQSDDVLEDAEALVAAYGEMMNAVREVRDKISAESPDSARELVGGALALDVIMLQYREGKVAVAGPLHPFHLWRYTQIARIIKAHREELRSLSPEQIRQFTEPVVSSPHLVISHFLDHSLLKSIAFIGVGSLGYLPLYADPESRVATQLRASGLGKIAERFVRSTGHAVFGLDVVFVDPPSLADVLDAVLSVNRKLPREEQVPIHVRVFRTRPSPSSTDEEEDEMEELAEALRDCGGSLDVDSEPHSVKMVAERLALKQAHYTVVFEPGEATAFRIGADSTPRRSPLLLPRHYKYDRMKDRFTVHVSGDDSAFGAYHTLFQDHLQIPNDAVIGRRSGAQQWGLALAEIAKSTMWLSVIDQDVEPTFTIDGAVCLERAVVGDRDLLTFTSYSEILDRSLHHVIEEAGLPATDATRARTHRLFRRLGGNLLSEVVGRAVTQQCVGLVGVLGVVDWHVRTTPDAILATLDSAAARAWILNAVEGDNRRGDMLCLRPLKNGGLRLDVIEVKTREKENSVLQVSGKKMTGAAPEQIDNTITALTRILGETPDVLDCTRKEVLKDQMYQAVASQELDSKQRQRAVAMLEEFFRDGPSEIGGRVFVVHLEPGAPFASEALGKGGETSPAGHPIDGYRLTFGEADEDGDEDLPGRADEPPTPPSPPSEGGPRSSSAAKKTSTRTTPAASAPRGRRSEPKEQATERIELPAAANPATELRTTSATPPSAPDSVCIHLGADPLGKPITWDTAANPGFGLLVTGDTGFGKTQTLRVVIAEVRAAQLPVLIFDYKPDYSDDAFTKAHGLKVYDVKRRGLPFNPLALMPDKNGEVYPYDQIYELAEIFRRVLDLGEQQENRIVEAQAKAYRAKGWDPQAYSKFDSSRSFPTFADVMAELEAMKKDNVAKTTFTRLKKFLDMNLFPSEASESTFDQLIGSSVVLAMNELPPELANTLSEVLIVKLHGTLRRGPQPRKLRRLLVFDEAWRVRGSSKLTELAREGRAFGVGLAIGTQNPKDLPPELVSCLRAQVFLCNKDPDNQKAIARAVCGQASGREAQRIIDQVKGLAKFQGIIISEQFKEGWRVNIVPYSDRSYPSVVGA